MIKAEFSASLLQSSVSHDPSEIILIYWFAAQETFLLLLSIFKTVESFLFRILWLIERPKAQHLSEIKCFCNIVHYTIQKLGVSIYFFIWKEIWFSKDALNWSKMLQKISISDKCCLFSKLSIHQRNLNKFYSAVLNVIIIIIHVFSAANQDIRMISEGSCDWSNDAKTSALKF